jgi:hypothetical protein
VLAARSRCPSCVGKPKVLSLDPFQTSVRILRDKPCRVPLAADALLHLLVLFVFRVSQCREQFVVAVDAAAILWRARARPAGAVPGGASIARPCVGALAGSGPRGCGPRDHETRGRMNV